MFCDFVLILPHPFSTVTTTSQLFAALLFSGHLLNSSQFYHLFTPQLILFHLFPALVNSSQRPSPLPTSFQLFSIRLNSSHLFHLFSTLHTSFHLRSIHFTSFSANLNFSRSLSTLLNSCQLSPPLFTEMLYTGNLLHTEAFCTPKFLHREVFTHIFFTFFLHTTSFYTEKPLHTPCFYTEKLSHRASVTLRFFYTEKT